MNDLLNELHSQEVPSDSELINKSFLLFDELNDLVLKKKKSRTCLCIAQDGNDTFVGCAGNELSIAQSLVQFLNANERISLFFDRIQFANGIEEIDAELEERAPENSDD